MGGRSYAAAWDRCSTQRCTPVPARVGMRDAAAGTSMPEIGQISRLQPTDDGNIRESRSGFATRPGWERCAMSTLRSSVQDCLAMRRGLGFKLRDAGSELLNFCFVHGAEARHYGRRLSSIVTAARLRVARSALRVELEDHVDQLRQVAGIELAIQRSRS